MKARDVVLGFAMMAGCAAKGPVHTETWAPEAKVETPIVSSGHLRTVELGQGPPLVLLHTIRTQADYFQRLAPLLADRYHVIALDLPGHGQASIEDGQYDEARFRRAVVEFIVQRDLHEVTLLGESIGGVLALTVAAELPDRVVEVYSLNPYDYGDSFAGGIRRSAGGKTIALFRRFKGATPETKNLLRKVMHGGFHDPSDFPENFLSELDRAGKRRGFRRVEYSTFANWHSWIDARERYAAVEVPVTLIYGRSDWSLPAEREANEQLLEPSRFVVIDDAGHFSALERPDAIATLVLDRGSDATGSPSVPEPGGEGLP